MNSVHQYVKAALLDMLSKRTDAQRDAADQATKHVGDILAEQEGFPPHPPGMSWGAPAPQTPQKSGVQDMCDLVVTIHIGIWA